MSSVEQLQMHLAQQQQQQQPAQPPYKQDVKPSFKQQVPNPTPQAHPPPQHTAPLRPHPPVALAPSSAPTPQATPTPAPAATTPAPAAPAAAVPSAASKRPTAPATGIKKAASSKAGAVHPDANARDAIHKRYAWSACRCLENPQVSHMYLACLPFRLESASANDTRAVASPDCSRCVCIREGESMVVILLTWSSKLQHAGTRRRGAAAAGILHFATSRHGRRNGSRRRR